MLKLTFHSICNLKIVFIIHLFLFAITALEWYGKCHSICLCVREFVCGDLRVVNSRTRTRLRKAREMGAGRRRQRTELWTVLIVY